ncbi:MAG: GNAT family N-acetyltransferase [Lachnospiraceae bacterium]|nr:GNAT family N-acetyltransferase [Lachnospiraceae bacterium]
MNASAIRIIKTDTLDAKQLLAVKELEALCRKNENLTGSLFLSSELNEYPNFPCFMLLYENNFLSAFLSVFIPAEDEAEISVCTHPEHRLQGFCNMLLDEAFDLLDEYGINNITFVTEPNGKAFSYVLKSLEAVKYNSEYFMTFNAPKLLCDALKDNGYELWPAPAESLSAHIDLHHRAFDIEYNDAADFVSALFNDNSIKPFSLYDKTSSEILGSCYIDESVTDSLIILGVSISPSHQGKGLGRNMMLQLISKYALSYGKQIMLQVSGNNLPAKHLYDSLGFTVTSQFDYWYLP